MILTYDQFKDKVRFLFGDTVSTNLIQRESIIARPGNVVDGNNKIFLLFNRRISQIHEVYDEDGNTLDPSTYTVNKFLGKIIFTPPPARPLFIDYSWYRLTDEELSEAISTAGASGGFNPSSVSLAMVDYAAHFAVSYAFSAAASRAAEYYTLSASGKQVSKSEVYNHYVAMSQSFLEKAQNLRTDFHTRRGTRDVPAGEDSANSSAVPYFPTGETF